MNSKVVDDSKDEPRVEMTIVGATPVVAETDDASPAAVPRRVAAWALQTGASTSWLVSVFIYNSYETGDIFQLLAASLWTVSNLLALPDAQA